MSDERTVYVVELDEVGVFSDPTIPDDFVFSTRAAAEQWLESEYEMFMDGPLRSSANVEVVEYRIIDSPPEASDE